MSTPAFSRRVIRWQRVHGRHDLPWQDASDPYRVWLSEIMLQQTQVTTVIPYYERFVARFPTVADLARASEDEVLGLWSGLGYYARGRNLLRAARHVVEKHGGRFPTTYDDLAQLPGVGRSTAGAIAALAGGERRAILDGNVRRVLARHGGVAPEPSGAQTLERLWSLAESRLPARDIAVYTQGMMDLGAAVCTARKPACARCPLARDCVARIEDRVAELPGKRARAPARRRGVTMLVVVSHGEVLLEKRAASGIWGGMWSLPEAAPGADPGDVLKRDWGLDAVSARPLPPFAHAFTHFTLDITPWLLRPRRADALLARRSATWLPLTELAGAALPAPVRKLLSGLAGGRRPVVSSQPLLPEELV